MQQNHRTLNPYASMAANGLMNNQPVGFTDISFDYVYTVTLTASQSLNGEQQAISTDSDFMWRALVFKSTGAFSVRFSDSQAYFLSDVEIWSDNLSNDGSSPYVVFPEVPFPAGSRIGIDITDLSGSSNDIQLVFRGVKRFVLAG
ncbi:hypothetical protein LCGC14_2480040 [marine sediment metagenome]|uniref:Uncharacterized protein n=1 Tax=marine sediment metagenome TaxID=412755 RepID=A0A0F9DJX1_9ZZZZ